MPASEPIYTSESFYFRIPNVKLNDSAVTDAANIPDSFTYDVRDVNGASLGSPLTGNMTYSATAIVNGVVTPSWQAVIVAPSAAGTLHLHAVLTKGTNVGFFHDSVNISSRQ